MSHGAGRGGQGPGQAFYDAMRRSPDSGSCSCHCHNSHPVHASRMLTEAHVARSKKQEEERSWSWGPRLAEIANLRVFILMPFYFDFNARPKCVRRFLIFFCLSPNDVLLSVVAGILATLLQNIYLFFVSSHLVPATKEGMCGVAWSAQ